MVRPGTREGAGLRQGPPPSSHPRGRVRCNRRRGVLRVGSELVKSLERYAYRVTRLEEHLAHVEDARRIDDDPVDAAVDPEPKEEHPPSSASYGSPIALAAMNWSPLR